MNRRSTDSDSLSGLFNSLAGQWKFERIIENQGQADGNAAFNMQSSGNLLYREEGIYQSQTEKQYRIFREYLYSCQNNQISVYFVENNSAPRLFYTLMPVFIDHQCRYATGRHLCLKDTYEAKYTFICFNEFTLRYQVNGPAKNYFIETHYVRKP
jgi:hypothetical protein